MRWPRARKAIIRAGRGAALVAALFVVAAVIFSLCSPPFPLIFPPTPEASRHPAQAAGIANYTRDEVDTFYTFPEWYIVWSYQSKADFQSRSLPSGYSYFGDIGQFWHAYSRMYAATRRVYPFATGDHVMLVVIGSSFAVEYALKGAYENTIGRLSEWTSGDHLVAEDQYAAKVAQDYAAFVHVRPFYEFSFAHALHGLWRDTPFQTAHLLRTLERRTWLSLDYAVESLYCELIELATHAMYGYEDVNTAAWIEFPAEAKARVLASVKSMKLARDLGPTEAIVEIPRYQEFTTDAQTLLEQGARFRQIAGNELLVISAIAPAGWKNDNPKLQLLEQQLILTARDNMRIVLLARVSDLNDILAALARTGVKLEHLYDY
jgi:hypothetical protein